MFQPKKVKYRKQHKGRKRQCGLSKAGNEISFGNFGIKAVEYKWIDSRQLEACRRAIVRYIQKGGKIWIRIFPHQAVTSKGGEMGMGHGKGGVDKYIFPVKPGRILFELDGVSEEIAREALRLAAHKLPIKTKFIKR